MIDRPITSYLWRKITYYNIYFFPKNDKISSVMEISQMSDFIMCAPGISSTYDVSTPITFPLLPASCTATCVHPPVHNPNLKHNDPHQLFCMIYEVLLVCKKPCFCILPHELVFYNNLFLHLLISFLFIFQFYHNPILNPLTSFWAYFAIK